MTSSAGSEASPPAERLRTDEEKAQRAQQQDEAVRLVRGCLRTWTLRPACDSSCVSQSWDLGFSTLLQAPAQPAGCLGEQAQMMQHILCSICRAAQPTCAAPGAGWVCRCECTIGCCSCLTTAVRVAACSPAGMSDRTTSILQLCTRNWPGVQLRLQKKAAEAAAAAASVLLGQHASTA